MAIQTFTQNLYQPIDYRVFTFAAMANGDTTLPLTFPNAGARTIQVQGTFGTGGTVIVEGSDDGANWYQLNDPSGTAISFTAAGLKQIREDSVFVRARVTGGDGTTAIVALFAGRRNNLG